MAQLRQANSAVADETVLHHFSEDDSIEVFEPHVPVTNPTQRAAVWAIDALHAPLYWFPRNCPRIAVWPADHDDHHAFETVFATSAKRVHFMEAAWVETMTATVLYRYDFDAAAFEPWPEAAGQWVAHETIRPVGCRRVGDLFQQHREAEIELRLVESLHPAARVAESDRWEFSMVRMANAAPENDGEP